MATSAAVPVAAESRVPRIRDLSIGGVLDDALLLVRERFNSLIVIPLMLMAVPLTAAMYFGFAPVQEQFAQLGNQGIVRPEDFVGILQHMGVVAIPLLTLAYRVAEPLALGALIFMLAGTLIGERPTLGQSLRRSLRLGWVLIILWFLRWLCVQVGTMACYIPGILLAGLFSVALPAAVLEGTGPLASLGRSVELNKQRMFPSMGLILLLGLIESMMVQLGQLMPNILLQSLCVGLLYSSTLCLYAAGVTVYYFAGRCKVENYDLQLLAEQVASKPEEPTETATSLFSPAS